MALRVDLASVQVHADAREIRPHSSSGGTIFPGVGNVNAIRLLPIVDCRMRASDTEPIGN